MGIGESGSCREFAELIKDRLALFFAHAFEISNPDWTEKGSAATGFGVSTHTGVRDRRRVRNLFLRKRRAVRIPFHVVPG